MKTCRELWSTCQQKGEHRHCPARGYGMQDAGDRVWTEGASCRGTIKEQFSLQVSTETPKQGEGRDQLFKAGNWEYPECQATQLLHPSSGKVHTRRLFPKILRHVPLSPGAAWPPCWLNISNGERKGQADSQKCLSTSLSFQASFTFENITAGWLLREAHRQPQKC